MDINNRNPKNKYDRVMPRVNSQGRSTVKSSFLVERHDISSSERIGAKPSVSNASSNVFSELPTVLNDFVPERSPPKIKQTLVSKPRKTLKSLDPVVPAPYTNSKSKRPNKISNIKVPASVPTVLPSNGGRWMDTHFRECQSSRSHSRIKELKDEIHTYDETEKLMRIRSNLFKKCGVVLNDLGDVAADKAVQVDDLAPKADDPSQTDIRTERNDQRENARATLPYQQMSSDSTRYPVDRYLVESSKKFEMVNIIDDDLWNIDTALKPEDELTLRKLHEMLQSTADDLKLLSGELSKFHQPGVHVKTTPTPLDEEFNEKVHIEEIVNAKFHGYKIIDKSSCLPEFKPRNDVINDVKPAITSQKPKINNTDILMNTAHKKSLKMNLGVTRTNIIQINGNQNSIKTEKLNNGKVINAPAVSYKEYSFKYVEPKTNMQPKHLQVQEMPRINIRSELKEQKVLKLDILPDYKASEQLNTMSNNVAVISLQHEIPGQVPATSSSTVQTFKPIQQYQTTKPTLRRVSKMSTCESSGSINNVSSDTQVKLKTQKRILTTITSPKNSARHERKKMNIKKERGSGSRFNLEDWRNKLNVVYGSSSTKNNRPKAKSKTKISSKKLNTPLHPSTKHSLLNNAEYIPYSKLTVGGAQVSDIEKELSEIPNKNNIPLSPIIDKILRSHRNSYSKISPQKPIANSGKILTTSDENLLQEVIDIERTVSETISKNFKNAATTQTSEKTSSDTEETKGNESYFDDFDDENSNNSGESTDQRAKNDSRERIDGDENTYSSDNNTVEEEQVQDSKPKHHLSTENVRNLTKRKTLNLSLKNKIDVFEYVHAVDTQDSTTQSNGRQIISPKETQTTPRNDKNVQPIHNDLWPSMDPNVQVEKMFELEKEFIKKFILDEYGDILEKDITKPSTSNDIEGINNVVTLQKNTQTSPAHVKNVMTSPTKTKTRTTSPFIKSTVDHHTSPLIFVSNVGDMKAEVEDLSISINLSSPRFSLRLPHNSQEVLSNMGDSLKRMEKKTPEISRKNSMRNKTPKSKNNNHNITSSSSIEADSSEISSLGEIRLRRMLNKMKINSDCESFCSTSSKCSSDLQSGILPLKSEGEMSLGLNAKSSKHYKSEGEASFGFL